MTIKSTKGLTVAVPDEHSKGKPLTSYKTHTTI